MEQENNDEGLALLSTQLKTIDSLRKQLAEGGSITLTEAEHHDFINHLANTLVAFRLFLFTENTFKASNQNLK